MTIMEAAEEGVEWHAGVKASRRHARDPPVKAGAAQGRIRAKSIRTNLHEMK